jgi:hypothetical protein
MESYCFLTADKAVSAAGSGAAAHPATAGPRPSDEGTLPTWLFN